MNALDVRSHLWSTDFLPELRLGLENLRAHKLRQPSSPNPARELAATALLQFLVAGKMASTPTRLQVLWFRPSLLG